MYWNINKAGSWDLKVLKYGITSPYGHLINKFSMMNLRQI